MKKILLSIILNIIVLVCTGQTLIKNIVPGAGGSGGHDFYNWDSTRMIFFGTDGSGGSSANCLFITDGTNAGTFTLTKLNDQYPNTYSKIDSLGFFLGQDSMGSPVFIRTNGTISGTSSHIFSYPPGTPSYPPCTRPFKMANKICWIYTSYGGENPGYLFNYDILTNTINYVSLTYGWSPLSMLYNKKRYNSGITLGQATFNNYVLSNDTNFFCYIGGAAYDSIFRVDISGAKHFVTTGPHGIMPWDQSGVGVLLGSKFMFTPSSSAFPSSGKEPYCFDILSYSFGILKDVNPYFSYNSNPMFIPLPLYTQGFTHNYIYFMADHADYGREMWITDGTTAGTHIVEDLNPGPMNGIYGCVSCAVQKGFYYIGDSLITSVEHFTDSIRFIKPNSIFTFNNLSSPLLSFWEIKYFWSSNSKGYFLDNRGQIYAPPYNVVSDTLSRLSCPYINFGTVIENNGCLILNQANCGYTGSEPFIYCNNSLFASENELVLDKQKLILFPNPAEDLINIQLENGSIDNISIYNSVGQELINLNGSLQINISNLSAGYYIINVSSDKDKTSHFAKFIKQ